MATDLENRIRRLKKVIKFRDTDEVWRTQDNVYDWMHSSGGKDRYVGRLEALEELNLSAKRTITLQGGDVVDCGVTEFKNLGKAIKAENPKLIVKNTLELMMSSKVMMKKLSDASMKIMKGDLVKCKGCGKLFIDSPNSTGLKAEHKLSLHKSHCKGKGAKK